MNLNTVELSKAKIDIKGKFIIRLIFKSNVQKIINNILNSNII